MWKSSQDQVAAAGVVPPHNQAVVVAEQDIYQV